jgi:hypothetical protein
LKEFVPEMDMKGVADKAFPEMSDQIGRNRIHSDNHERKCPAAVSFDVNDPRKKDEKEKAKATAKESPTWGPDTLDNRADACEM